MSNSNLNTDTNEQIIGIVLYGYVRDYDINSYIFTNKQVLQVSLSQMNELASKEGLSKSITALIIGSALFSGLGGFAGLKMWKDLKNKTSGQPVVKIEKTDLSAELVSAATIKLSYDKIKEVKIKKVMMSSDFYVNLAAGFLHTLNITFEARAVEDVKNLIKSTPLAPKLQG